MKRPHITNAPAPDYVGVSTVITAPDGNEIIVCANNLEILKSYLSDETGYPESRKACIFLGPRVELPGIQELLPSGLETAKQFAEKLGTRVIGKEITDDEEAEAKALGLVVVFGYSDDCTEFCGAIHDEVGYGDLTLSDNGKILDDDEMEALESLLADGTIKTPPVLGKIRACWCQQGTDIPWTYQTTIPHATFDVLEGGDVFCRGIVFSISDLK